MTHRGGTAKAGLRIVAASLPRGLQGRKKTAALRAAIAALGKSGKLPRQHSDWSVSPPAAAEQAAGAPELSDEQRADLLDRLLRTVPPGLPRECLSDAARTLQHVSDAALRWTAEAHEAGLPVPAEDLRAFIDQPERRRLLACAFNKKIARQVMRGWGTAPLALLAELVERVPMGPLAQRLPDYPPPPGRVRLGPALTRDALLELAAAGELRDRSAEHVEEIRRAVAARAGAGT